MLCLRHPDDAESRNLLTGSPRVRGTRVADTHFVGSYSVSHAYMVTRFCVSVVIKLAKCINITSPFAYLGKRRHLRIFSHKKKKKKNKKKIKTE